MFPDQQNQTGGPQNSYQPPQTGVNSTPVQAANGQYAVVPPLPTINNVGHSGHNPYEFIVNPNTPKRGGIALGGGFGMRIGLLVGGAVVLMILIAIVMSALAPKSSTPGLTAIAQRQQEIMRISAAAELKTNNQDTKNFVTSANLSITSSQQQITGYLATKGTKLKSKTLALDQNTQTDTLLANADSAGTYDVTAVQVITSQLQTYEGQLQASFKQTHSTQAKAVLQQCYTSADKLLAQAKQLNAND